MKHIKTFEGFLNESQDPNILKQHIEDMKQKVAQYQQQIVSTKKGIEMRKSEMRDTDPGDQDQLKQSIAKSQSRLEDYESNIRGLTQAIEKAQQQLAEIQKGQK